MKRVLLYGLIGLVVLFIASAFAFAIFQPVKVLPRIRLAPGFALTDQYGQQLTNEDLRGKIVLYNFTYTRCPAPCRGLDETMLEVQQQLSQTPPGGVLVRLVTISLDPQYDTPETLRGYSESIGADEAIWYFATTTNTSLLKTIVGAGFEVYYASSDEGESIDLTPAFVLVDSLGIIRGEYQYRTNAPDANRILRHIAVLQEEAQKSIGAGRLVYEAAHLFMCYAP